jgi:uncharacterized protein (TIGR01777 family)
MHVVVAGSSGYMGQELTRRLRASGHDVLRLVRRPPAAADERQWDPALGILDQEVVDEADVVVNLCGSRLLGIPYNPGYYRKLRASRVPPTRVLAEAVARSANPAALIVACGSSAYGDHGDSPVTEESELRGTEPLARLVRDWEAAASPAQDAGARVCTMRTAPVISPGSETTNVLVPLFRLGLGVRLSSGHQYFPVVSQRDRVAAATFLIESTSASGPFNVCCPVTPTNAEFTDALAAALGRRARLAAPAPILRLGAGPMAGELLRSMNMRPAALLAEGFEFEDRDVDAVMAQLV